MYGGGAERIVLYLLNNLDRSIFKPYLILFHKEGHYLNKISSDVDIICLSSNSSLFHTLDLSKELGSIVEQYSLDMINSHLTSYNIPVLRARLFSRKLKIPIVITEHSNFSIHLIKYNWKKLAYKLQVHLLYKNKSIICVSEGTKNDLANALSLNIANIKVIYNPVDIQNIKEQLIKKSQFIPLHKNGSTIVAVGRLNYVKGFDLLIAAFSDVVKKLNNAKLYIIGDGKDKNNLQELVDKLGLGDSVIFTGFLENPWSEISAADLFVLSSRWEGFGNVIIEAMVSGTAVLSVDCNFGPNEIIDNELTGKLISPNDKALLANTILELLCDPEKKNFFVQNASEAVAKYDICNFIEMYQEVFIKVYKKGIRPIK